MSGDVLGLPDWAREFVDYAGDVNYMKGGIERANKVTTVSQTYAREILNSYFGYGMNDILVNRQYKLSGIINGIDVKSNDPKTDKNAYVNYDLATFDKKVENKTRIPRRFGIARRRQYTDDWYGRQTYAPKRSRPYRSYNHKNSRYGRSTCNFRHRRLQI